MESFNHGLNICFGHLTFYLVIVIELYQCSVPNNISKILKYNLSTKLGNANLVPRAPVLEREVEDPDKDWLSHGQIFQYSRKIAKLLGT